MTLVPTPELLERYVDGDLDAATAVSVELHLERSEAGRAQVNALAEPQRIDDNWAGITAELDAPAARWIERLLVRTGMREHVARLMVATPSLRRSWFIAVGVAIFFSVAAVTEQGSAQDLRFFLVVAPLVPVLGVALAYGPGVDPAYEITVAAPVSGLRLVLTRAVAVLAFSVAVEGVVAMLAPATWFAVAWLVPSLALSAVCIALMTWLPPRTSAAWVVGVWVVATALAAVPGPDRLAMFRPAGQVVVALVGVAAAVVTYVRRERFEAAGAGLP